MGLLAIWDTKKSPKQNEKYRKNNISIEKMIWIFEKHKNTILYAKTPKNFKTVQIKDKNVYFFPERGMFPERVNRLDQL